MIEPFYFCLYCMRKHTKKSRKFEFHKHHAVDETTFNHFKQLDAEDKRKDEIQSNIKQRERDDFRVMMFYGD